ncbi:hypothetical protein [Candidatus Methylomicrobium oryzae]|jgi:hypothetical protein|uniref:hypothetical protein n=1 Tax=Candidatus Methylomicrobium oryzae TaxID=2802053 RepID=UPI001924B336|nr:hypothetical protein [Methylomicrobium sp. RS1]MBL1264529.1 hypothetical protein [Methylomicrobium sp. RS1]
MKKLLAVLIFAIAGNAYATGETFALTIISGTEYCPGLRPLKLNRSNSRKFFIRFDTESSASVFFDAVKATPDFVADLKVSFIGLNQLSFDAFFYADNNNHAEMIGTINLDKYGYAKTLAGTYLSAGLGNNQCYDVGKMIGKRIS